MGGSDSQLLLPLRVAPEADETLVGFLHRLTARNGLESPLWLARNVGISFLGLEIASYTSFDLEPLSRISGIPGEALLRMTYWPTGGDRRLSFLGHAVRREFFALRQRRLCPHCLADSPYHRAVWDLAPLTVCPIHAVRLITICPSCVRPLRWNFGTVTSCRCGIDLRAASPDGVPHADVAGAAHVHRMLGLWFAPDDRGSTSAKLDGFDADETMSLLLHLGWAATGERLRPRPSKLATVRNDMHRWLNVGLEACRDWPGSFLRYLNDLTQRAAKRPGRWGAEKQFGWLIEWANDPRESEAVRSLVLEAVEQYPTSSASNGGRQVVEHGDHDLAITLSEAARLLGRSQARVLRVFRRYGLLTDEGAAGDDVAAVDAGTVEVIKRDLDDLVARENLSRELGCSDRAASMVLGFGFVERARGPAADLFGRAAWRRSELGAFVKLLERRARQCPSPDNPVPLPQAIWRPGSGGAQRSLAAERLLCGRAARLAVDRRAMGLGRILVDVGSVSTRSSNQQLLAKGR